MDLSKYFWGTLFILLGVLFFADQFIVGLNAWSLIGKLWPLIFVFIGVSALYSKPRNIVAGTGFITFGIIALLALSLDVSFWKLWPIFLVFIGVSIIFKRSDYAGSEHLSKESNAFNEVVSSAVFWGNEIRNDSKEFKGANLTALFGGIKLDLRDAVVAKEGAIIEVTSTFAGIEIDVPRDAEVIVEGTGILGGFENKSRQPAEKKGGKLLIRGSAIFGGVEVR